MEQKSTVRALLVCLAVLLLAVVAMLLLTCHANQWQPEQIIEDGWTLRWEQDGFNCYSYDIWLRESDRDTWAPAKNRHVASRIWYYGEGGLSEVSEGVCQAHVAEAYSDHEFMVVSPLTPGVTSNPDQEVLKARRN